MYVCLRVPDTLELELEMVASYHMGAGTYALIGQKYFELQSLLSSPLSFFEKDWGGSGGVRWVGWGCSSLVSGSCEQEQVSPLWGMYRETVFKFSKHSEFLENRGMVSLSTSIFLFHFFLNIRLPYVCTYVYTRSGMGAEAGAHL